MYRAVDTGLRAIDVRTLTEAAETLGAGWPRILFTVILPNVRMAVLSGAFLTFAIVIGEFTMASLLSRPAFGPYLQLMGANRAYEPSALAIIAFIVTWACMGLIGLRAWQSGHSTGRRVARGRAMAFLEIDKARKIYGTKPWSRASSSRSSVANSSPSSGPAAAARRRPCAWWRVSRFSTSGTIRINDHDVTGLRPNQRKVGMMFQAYALFPNMTVAENVGFGLKVAKRPAAEIKSRVEEMLNLIKLPQMAGRYPYQLSGGQQQRVALARALANKPQVLLLDEPLSALDAKIRISLREEIRAVQRELGITTIYVTHDQEEALSMSDRVVVMSEGRMEQVGTPFEIYNFPRTRFAPPSSAPSTS